MAAHKEKSRPFLARQYKSNNWKRPVEIALRDLIVSQRTHVSSSSIGSGPPGLKTGNMINEASDFVKKLQVVEIQRRWTKLWWFLNVFSV
jgi:hypothetical protein